MNKVIKDEVYKCSKCGLCKSVCPIYIATKNEMFLPRGRFILLNNFFNNGKKFSKQFIRNLDICLNCNLCKDFCPSGIDSVSVYSSLKKRSIFFELKINLFFMCSSLFNFKKKIYPSKSEFTEKVLYFEGCFNKYIDPSDRNASIEIIQKLGFKVEKIISQCCGYKYLSSANMKKFKENATNIIEKCNGDFSYIICSCDSCFETLSKFQNSDFTSKLITLDKFLELNHIKFDMISDSKCLKSISRKDKIYFPDNSSIEREVSIPSYMENFFSIKYPKLSKSLSEKLLCFKNQNLITTSNHTKYSFRKFLKQNIVSYSEFVLKYFF